ncbi:tyrosine-type recombinase/integrase [Bradyrhizobium sp. LB11.1]|uniref:tyrosine-type recombinase/integrase n=1 Tax=Bradyrhizobium sp. LB11.1 TaxID=3156326 RepID=UPI00339669E0
MFEEIFFPRTAERYRAAPLVEQRERYLVHLRETGAERPTLRKCANDQLSLVRLLNLKEGSRVRLSQIEAATAIWSQPKGRRCDRSASSKAKARFVTHAVRWLRLLGWLDEPERERHPHHAKVAIFEKWLRQERGLSTATIQDYCRATDHFFFRLAGKGVPLSAVRMTDIDDVITAEHKRGAWNRRTMHDYAQRLRAFFRFAETRGWCVRGVANGIMPPRFMRDEGVPKGLKRVDVQRLLATTEGDRPVDKRDRAILMLFIAYGLRAGEVGGLRLDDLSWKNEILRVRCPKPGRTNTYPLSQGVGDAILRYIREVRPSGFGRALFFTMRAPIRPLDRRALGKIVKDRLASLGIIAGKRGTHALRHAAAQHLLDQGMSMKVIGDLLGHRDPSSTAIYAKVNLAALREVATLDLEGLS